MLRRLRQLGAFLLDLVYPPVCVLCGEYSQGELLCPACRRSSELLRSTGDDDPAPEPGFGFSFGAV